MVTKVPALLPNFTVGMVPVVGNPVPTMLIVVEPTEVGPELGDTLVTVGTPR
jgi:hypothetical protein